MNHLLLLLLTLPVSTMLAEQPPSNGTAEKKHEYRIVQSRTGKELTLEQLAEQLATHDVVYFGELHDNEKGHKAYADLARLLAERRPDLVIAMEMFERDVQGVVNDYLRGKIDEATFLKHSRPWKNYARDYKPLMELARERKLDVIAGNIPRPVASKVASKEGSTSKFLPRSSTTPQDKYWELFSETMKSHPNAEGAVERMYRAQCAKDDAMAEGIADYLATNPHRQPFVIQCNGNFHSDYGLGTATRVAQRVPLAQSAIITMLETPDVSKADVTEARKKAQYVLVVPASPKPAVEKQEPKPGDKAKTASPIPNKK